MLWQQESVTKPAYDASKARLDAARAKVDAATAAVAAARQRPPPRQRSCRKQNRTWRHRITRAVRRYPARAAGRRGHARLAGHAGVHDGGPAPGQSALQRSRHRTSPVSRRTAPAIDGRRVRERTLRGSRAVGRSGGRPQSAIVRDHCRDRQSVPDAAIGNDRVDPRRGDGPIIISCAYLSTRSFMIPPATNTSCTPWSRRTEASPLPRPFTSAPDRSWEIRCRFSRASPPGNGSSRPGRTCSAPATP